MEVPRAQKIPAGAVRTEASLPHTSGTLARGWLVIKSVVDLARQYLMQCIIKPRTCDAFVNSRRIKDKTRAQIVWTRGRTEDVSLEADLSRGADGCCTGAFGDENSFVWPVERRRRRAHARSVVIGDGVEAEARATTPIRRLTAGRGVQNIIRTQYAVSRITVESNAAVLAVGWFGLWPCPTGAAMYNNSDHDGSRSEQQAKRRVPGLPATERSGRRSACCGAWTGHSCRSDGSCLNWETGMRPTWEHMLVCTQLNFDAIDFSEIPQTRVEELRRTVEKDTYAACAMVLKSRCNPPEDAPVEHEARVLAVRRALSIANDAGNLHWRPAKRSGFNLGPVAAATGCDRTSR